MTQEKLKEQFLEYAENNLQDDTIYYLIDDKIIYGVSESTGDDCLILPIKTF